MPNLDEVYRRLETNKKKQKEINTMLRDECTHHPRHEEVMDEMKVLRDEKKSIEQDVRAGVPQSQELEELKAEILTDQEILSDLALNLFMKNETVEIKDEFDRTWLPVFKVTFKKS